MKNVAAIVVTYNRKELLKKCLNALLDQQLGVIIVVDNNSSDGTKEMVEKEYLNNSIFDYHYLESNTGGSGGFNYGLSRAYDDGYEWFWLMDDDVAPVEKSIDIYGKYISDYSFIQGRRAYEDGAIFDWLSSYDYKNGKEAKLSEEVSFKDTNVIEVDTACFEGAFINRRIVESIGLPDKSFFIQGDDTTYGILANKEFKIAYISETTLVKTMKKPQTLFLNRVVELSTPFSIYYNVRNLFLIEQKIKEGFPNEDIDHKATIFKKIIKTLLKIILIFPEKSKSISFFFKGIRDGIAIIHK